MQPRQHKPSFYMLIATGFSAVAAVISLVWYIFENAVIQQQCTLQGLVKVCVYPEPYNTVLSILATSALFWVTMTFLFGMSWIFTKVFGR